MSVGFSQRSVELPKKRKNICLADLLNTSAGAEADVRVDMTLHLTVVVAVCLREHAKKKKKSKIQSRENGTGLKQNMSIVLSTVK